MKYINPREKAHRHHSATRHSAPGGYLTVRTVRALFVLTVGLVLVIVVAKWCVEYIQSDYEQKWLTERRHLQALAAGAGLEALLLKYELGAAQKATVETEALWIDELERRRSCEGLGAFSHLKGKSTK